MIIYLTDAKHTSSLDFLDIPIKKMVGTFNLKNFVMLDIRNLNHCTDLVLQHLAFDDTQDDFVQALTELKTLSDVRVTLIGENLSDNLDFISALKATGISNIITAQDVEQQREELLNALTQINDNASTFRFNAKNISIAVCASQSRIGCTSAALNLSIWLESNGARVNYVQANESTHLQSIAEAYELEQNENAWTLGKCIFSNTPIGSKKLNFFVYDIGANLDSTLLKTADKILAVVGTKPYEIAHTSELMSRVNAQKITLICNFTSHELQEDYYNAFKNENNDVAFLDFQTDIMDTSTNSSLWRKIISQYLKVGI